MIPAADQRTTEKNAGGTAVAPILSASQVARHTVHRKAKSRRWRSAADSNIFTLSAAGSSRRWATPLLYRPGGVLSRQAVRPLGGTDEIANQPGILDAGADFDPG